MLAYIPYMDPVGYDISQSFITMIILVNKHLSCSWLFGDVPSGNQTIAPRGWRARVVVGWGNNIHVYVHTYQMLP